MSTHALLALLAGASIAVQAALNTSLGLRLGHPLLASVVAFAVALAATLVAALLFVPGLPGAEQLRAVPPHLWLAGGLLAAGAIVIFYWLIPRQGLGPTLALALTGQLLLALVATHWGWFGLPEARLSPLRLTGAGTLVLGIFLIQHG